ncbi:hypothetical protein A3A46_03875 [Candidatus Roizmanbacteria bacterium RIFCSPLOWO2_01_FULL_37_13]|uniref:50S ribosomal protein L22 n=1 Tax=Candidatus Roizmanbacteria bacterium RIFCSPHIGHO2_02_FULL_38_11 TaxID=1802039 RepID=A0A1F7H2M1_9BACT|nr:MAG: hypothetical protein A3C25_03570 [Candidatus Roizmanbacteria bacterium RIFCSPHIGHO2_02_FULL_38_11]OGK35427.1 MAG: hypothetical protein A3F58_02795 [Candidatus Roizmanbacteria bacterium RIFCSPHIGHO2_12_FULL_37_9b]OGK40917.1 MAG: hypothetical protein A3A46_03875 [Candidatus Roizmanbacteria bacterium RIFCSPLOWO2_01_FULL_37_13]
MESITYSKNLKISPKKLRFLLPAIKKLKPAEILDYLMYTPKRSAEIFYNVIKSALSNAKNVLKVDEKILRFKHLSVEDGNRLKRFKAGGRGTAKPILRRFSHIKIILEAKDVSDNQRNSNVKTQISKPNLKSKKLSTKK